MARSVPPEPIWPADASPAEQALWRWTVEQLPERVRVLPGVHLTDFSDGQRDAEVDLVLIDPDWGVLAVEVKGGPVCYDERHRRWWRQLAHGGRREVRDPVQQAQRAASFVRRALAQNDVIAARVAVGWQVAVPEARLVAPGGAYLPEHKLWDALAADQLDRSFAQACQELGVGEAPPGETGAERIVTVLRGRAVQPRPSAAAGIEVHERDVLARTESHRDALYAFAHHRRVLVEGAAGTGKTVLAIEAAATRAAAGDRTLLVCWNRVLGGWLAAQLQGRLEAMGSPMAEAVSERLGGQVVAGHAPMLVRRASNQPDPDVDTHQLFHDVLPQRLTPELAGGAFDAVTIDEAQDLTDTWALALADLLDERGRLVAFAHTEQDLFGAGAPIGELCEHTHTLTESFRFTRQIADAAAALTEPLDGAPADVEHVAGDGPPVRYVAAEPDAVAHTARKELDRLRRDDRLADADLALLHLFTNPYRGEAQAVVDADAAGELVETNCATFKGRERPAVVLALDLRADKADHGADAARAAYVGATRARSQLVVVGDPDVVEAYGFNETARRLTSTP
jgi:hypothetical protein